MKQEIGVIPAKCVDCKTHFDLKYDLAGELPRNARIDEIVNAISHLGKYGLLCWDCRNQRMLQKSF